MDSERPKHHFWFRHEVKLNEHRTLVLPEHAKILIEDGHKVTVERSTERCIPDEEYEKVGCELVEGGTWPNAPKDAIICGLKELAESNEPLIHRHIYFAHCFKGQSGAYEILKRFSDGGGLLWDLEFLVNEDGRRVAAFGFSAGAVGLALGVWTWANQVLGIKPSLSPLTKPYDSWESLKEEVMTLKEKAVAKIGREPRVIIFGALGRCGSGAVSFAERLKIEGDNIAKWDINETKNGGPFKEVNNYDIMLNCIYLASKIPPFITNEILALPGRKLSVIVDVSCDATNPHNPLPVYSKFTTFDDPIVEILSDTEKPIDIISIDHLPSLVPSESSREFAGLMIQHLREYDRSDVWKRALNYFKDVLKQYNLE